MQTGQQQVAPESIPFKKDESTASDFIVQIGLTFVFVIAVAAGGLFLLKRYWPGIAVTGINAKQRITVLEVKRLNQKTTLFLVEFEGTQLLLGQCADQIVRLDKPHEMPVKNREDIQT